MDRVDREDLAATIAALAPLERPPCSPGEHEAARWIAARLEELGCRVAVDEEEAFAAFAPALAQLTGLGVVAGALALAGARRTALALGVAASAGIADDVSNGPRLFRRATMTAQPTLNVVAETGDPAGERTLVVLAHHDAAPTGKVFDPAGQQAFGERFPGLLERIDTSVPVWFPVTAGPALVGLGARRRSRRLLALGAALSAVSTAAFADIARSPITPGANDNLTAVAGLVALAQAFRDRPVPGLRVLLVSCGAEEALQGGMRGFAARHFGRLDREATWVLNFETLGSQRLVLLEGEGPLLMEDYTRLEFRDLVARCADRAGITLRRGMRSRASTDSVIASRAGYPTATLVSIDRHKELANYHRMTDTPENVDLRTVAEAVALGRGGRTRDRGAALRRSAILGAMAEHAHMTPDEFRRHGREVVEWVARYMERVGDLPIVPDVRPGEVRASMPDAAPEAPEPFSALLADLDDVVLPGITHWQSPGWFAYFPANVSGPSILAELASAGLGAQGMLWATSPALTEVENQVLDWLVELMGLPAAWRTDTGPGGGVIQMSASDSTHVVHVVAREQAVARGAGTDALVAYGSEQAHSSVERGARVAGFRNVRLVEVDEAWAMRPDALRAAIAEDLENGLVPAIVTSAIGTTGTGAVDPIEAIADVAAEHGLWHHVDAAWAGAARLCPEHRVQDAGVARADSFTFNPHKWLFTNFDCNVLWVADRAPLVETLSIVPPYLQNAASDAGEVIDYRDWHVALGAALPRAEALVGPAQLRRGGAAPPPARARRPGRGGRPAGRRAPAARARRARVLRADLLPARRRGCGDGRPGRGGERHGDGAHHALDGRRRSLRPRVRRPDEHDPGGRRAPLGRRRGRGLRPRAPAGGGPGSPSSSAARRSSGCRGGRRGRSCRSAGR
jgi:glutamate/tyrosine decarboxylase-like PLP-dependent enzyme